MKIPFILICCLFVLVFYFNIVERTDNNRLQRENIATVDLLDRLLDFEGNTWHIITITAPDSFELNLLVSKVDTPEDFSNSEEIVILSGEALKQYEELTNSKTE